MIPAGVKAHPGSATPYRGYEMGGNVKEWTALPAAASGWCWTPIKSNPLAGLARMSRSLLQCWRS